MWEVNFYELKLSGILDEDAIFDLYQQASLQQIEESTAGHVVEWETTNNRVKSALSGKSCQAVIDAAKSALYQINPTKYGHLIPNPGGAIAVPKYGTINITRPTV